MKWTIGDVTVTKIVEMEATGGSRFLLPQATPEAIQPIAWLQPHFADETGRLKMSIHSFIVQTPTRRIIVDTCLGNDKQGRRIPHWNDRTGPFLDDLAEAGFPAESIDTVLCTHLHVDHVGWNTKLERALGADAFQRPLSVWPHRVRALGQRAGPSGHGTDPGRIPSRRSSMPGLATLVDTTEQITRRDHA